MITAMKKEYISEETERELWWGERKDANYKKVGREQEQRKEIWVEAEKKPQGKECSHQENSKAGRPLFRDWDCFLENNLEK